jgi:hypothetical protein
MRARAVLAALAVIGCAAGPSWSGPLYVLGLGGSGGGPDEGRGFSVSGAVLWQVEPWMRIGPMLYADDQGTETGQLLDPNDGTELGTTALYHLMVYGGAWRADLPFAMGGRWMGLASGSLGYYRIQEDQAGVISDGLSTAGASLAFGVSHNSLPGSDLGITFRYHRLFQDLGDYWSATLEWTLRSGAGASVPASTATAPAKGN